MSVAAAIEKIREAGFTIEADGDAIAIEPFSELSGTQVDWLRNHKPEIISALKSSETLLDADGGNDLASANDERVSIRVPEYQTQNAKWYSFDMTVPRVNLPALRQSLRFQLKGGQGSGSILGQPGATEVHLRDVLFRKYGDQLATINGETP